MYVLSYIKILFSRIFNLNSSRKKNKLDGFYSIRLIENHIVRIHTKNGLRTFNLDEDEQRSRLCNVLEEFDCDNIRKFVDDIFVWGTDCKLWNYFIK
jgi:hypothetical protein